MSLTHTKGAMARRQAMLVLTVTITALSTASAAQVVPVATPRASTVRTRCVGCDSARVRRVLLATKLDSLRMEFTRRNVTDAEREVLSREMTTTILALEELIDASVRAGFSQMRVQDFPRASVGAVRRAPMGSTVTVTVQGGFKRGYLGITFDGPLVMDNERDSVRFFAYPLIASVDPSSPAERAGVLRGDTLIALNGTDVIDHLFSFTKLLVPDDRVTMKVRRQGDAKEFRIVVAEQPTYVVQRLPYMPGAYAPAPDAPGTPMPGRVRERPPTPNSRGGATSVPLDAPEPTVAFAYPSHVLFFNSVGGTRLEPLSEGLAKNLGVKGGLLVGRVVTGTPADQWGLREGDIILTADGETMSAVRDFVRAVEDRNRASDGVKVVVLRDKKQQDLIVK